MWLITSSTGFNVWNPAEHAALTLLRTRHRLMVAICYLYNAHAVSDILLNSLTLLQKPLNSCHLLLLVHGSVSEILLNSLTTDTAEYVATYFFCRVQCLKSCWTVQTWLHWTVQTPLNSRYRYLLPLQSSVCCYLYRVQCLRSCWTAWTFWRLWCRRSCPPPSPPTTHSLRGDFRQPANTTFNTVLRVLKGTSSWDFPSLLGLLWQPTLSLIQYSASLKELVLEIFPAF